MRMQEKIYAYAMRMHSSMQCTKDAKKRKEKKSKVNKK